MHLNFDMIKNIGGKATVVAILGTFLPILAGVGVMMAFNFELWPIGLSVGVALAPTSVGMALKMLGEKKQLGEPFGQLIVTAAFIDDIFSLVALTMLLQIGEAQKPGNVLSLWAILGPLIYSFLFCGIGALFAYPLDRSDKTFVNTWLLGWVGCFPRFVPPCIEALTDCFHEGVVNYIRNKCKNVKTSHIDNPLAVSAGDSGRGRTPSAEFNPEIMNKIGTEDFVEGYATKKPGLPRPELTRRKSVNYDDHYGEGRHAHQDVKFFLEDRVLLSLMFALLLGYGWVGALIGSHLLGAFIAGVSFCWMPDHAGLILWHSQVKRIAQWLIRLFFGATVAFSIPIKMMLDVEALWRGVILGLGPCIATKIFAGVFTGVDKWVVGFAMVGRGEFAYLVAQTAQATLLNPAPSDFNSWVKSHPLDMVHQHGGYYCYLGDCGNATSSHHRMLAGGGGGGPTEDQWCLFSDEGAMLDHGHPIAGLKYWKVGEDCNQHYDECDCQMMLSAAGFSMTVWALVMASVLAPLGFGAVLTKRLAAEATSPKSIEMPNLGGRSVPDMTTESI